MNVKSEPHEKTYLKNTIVLFILSMLIVLGLTGGTATYLYKNEINSFYSRLNSREVGSINLQRRITLGFFHNILTDLHYLSRQNELNSFFQDEIWSEFTELEYIEILKAKKTYDQIRYIDRNGKERIRVNFNNGNVNTVKKEGLQDKSHRYYFTESIALNHDEAYVSELDLSIEQGKIEIPYKPTIRFATPVFDDSNIKQGIVVINYLAKDFLQDIKQYGNTALGNSMLCNSNGYWLLSPNSDDEWGFMIEERKERSFKARYPEEWKTIEKVNQIQLETKNGFFTYTKVFPFYEEKNSLPDGQQQHIECITKPDASKYYWMLISHIPPEIIYATKKDIFKKHLFISMIALAILLPGAWFMVASIIKRNEYKARLLDMALSDTLTGLPNRRLFRERLSESIEHAHRFGRKMGLIYIDLDGFKEVNDTKGHDIGDELLIKVGEILNGTTRKTDIAARLGGDEFAIILFEVESLEGALNAAEHCISNIAIPVQLKSGTVKIGASIGIAVFPDHAETAEELIKQADKAMYYSKNHGKNKCSMSGKKL